MLIGLESHAGQVGEEVSLVRRKGVKGAGAGHCLEWPSNVGVSLLVP